MHSFATGAVQANNVQYTVPEVNYNGLALASSKVPLAIGGS